MTEVPDHLAPHDGLSDARIRFAGFDADGRGTIVSFEISQGDRVVGAFSFEMGSTGEESIDRMAALAHQKMNDALRQMLHENEALRRIAADDPSYLPKDAA